LPRSSAQEGQLSRQRIATTVSSPAPATTKAPRSLPGAAGACADRRRIGPRAPAATLVLNSLFAPGGDAN